jgi:aspartate racemase
MSCIGLIGGMSWESTSVYYRLLNELFINGSNSWRKPHIIVDSLDFGEIVTFQQAGNWSATGEILAQSAKRLEASGAEVIAIAANTMHINAAQIQEAVSIPLLDIRTSVANAVKAMAGDSISLLGTRYVIEGDFFSSFIENLGIRVVKPTISQGEELQRIIFDELTLGIVSDASRSKLIEIGQDCRTRGGDIVALCCTEFGLLITEENSPFPFIDSTISHVKDLLNFDSINRRSK